MLRAGITQIYVSKEVGANIRMLRRWWNNHMNGTSLENTPGCGRIESHQKSPKLLYPSLSEKSAIYPEIVKTVEEECKYLT